MRDASVIIEMQFERCAPLARTARCVMGWGAPTYGICVPRTGPRGRVLTIPGCDVSHRDRT